MLAVHLFGRPAPVEELPDLPLIEDAAGALGARRRGRACGSLGLLGCLSFHPRKIVTTGEGGAITTDDERIADAVAPAAQPRLALAADADMPAPGLNYRLSDLLCAIGLPQLRRLDELLAARDAHRRRLRRAPARAAGRPAGGGRRRRPRLAGLRDPGRAPRRGARRAARRGHRGADRHVRAPPARAYRDQGSFPGADHAFEQALALPFHTRLTESELDRVAGALGRLRVVTNSRRDARARCLRALRPSLRSRDEAAATAAAIPASRTNEPRQREGLADAADERRAE